MDAHRLAPSNKGGRLTRGRRFRSRLEPRRLHQYDRRKPRGHYDSGARSSAPRHAAARRRRHAGPIRGLPRWLRHRRIDQPRDAARLGRRRRHATARGFRSLSRHAAHGRRQHPDDDRRQPRVPGRRPRPDHGGWTPHPSVALTRLDARLLYDAPVALGIALDARKELGGRHADRLSAAAFDEALLHVGEAERLAHFLVDALDERCGFPSGGRPPNRALPFRVPASRGVATTVERRSRL